MKIKKIIQKQSHSSVINFVNHQTPNWIEGDAMITEEQNIALIAYGADCAMVSFQDETRIGICHVGWMGLVKGILDDMIMHFNDSLRETKCFVSPFLHIMEIKKDHCYQKLTENFPDRFFFEKDEKIFFLFREVIEWKLSSFKWVTFDPRNTLTSHELGSFRRTRLKGNGTQNRLVIMRDNKGVAKVKFFLPMEKIIFSESVLS